MHMRALRDYRVSFSSKIAFAVGIKGIAIIRFWKRSSRDLILRMSFTAHATWRSMSSCFQGVHSPCYVSYEVCQMY